MQAKTNTPARALNKAYRKEKVTRQEIDLLKKELPLLLDRISNSGESEENHKGHFQNFLREVWYRHADCLVATKGKIDLVIHDGPKAKDPVGVLIEAKRKRNQYEMFAADKPNVKSLHEAVLYFLRERNAGNTGLKTIMITDCEEVFLFPDREFERLFWEKKRFRNRVLAADADSGKTNSIAYEIISEHIEALDDTLQGTVVHLNLYRKYCEDGNPETDDQLIDLYKILSPAHLLRRAFAGDSNKLDKGFYRELLHLIGLEEVGVDSKGKVKKNGGKKIIRRATGTNRHDASLLENVLQIAGRDNRLDRAPDFRAYGNDLEERRFGVALELCTTWVNRVLFLKLLESQLQAYHREDERGGNVRFLTPDLVSDYDALNTLFIDVLNARPEERQRHVEQFAHVPYLNSSLFEISDLESVTLQVSALKDQVPLPLAPHSILRTRARARKTDAPEAMKPLEYLFAFLDAYDFSSEGKASIQEDNKRLINASVLGLIFEKINGYRDGSFYTPGFITEYMCRETIRRAVVQKFRDDNTHFAAFTDGDFDDLANFLEGIYKKEDRLAANALVNGLTVCDPAVGSGHFLVSALNELIATKSDLGILGADAGAKKVDIKAVVENDELIVTDRFGEPYEYLVATDGNGHVRADELTQTVQQTIFHEKRTLIENCLFGVDLNPNSVKICRLRLWIELLKNAYYLSPEERSEQSSTVEHSEHPRAVAKSNVKNRVSHIPYLQTLPNIDINIKQGNSLISRFALNDPLKGALADSGLNLEDYRNAVTDYHRASGTAEKQRLLRLIEDVKGNFQSHISRNDKRVKDLAKARGRMEEARINVVAAERFGISDAGVKKDRATIAKQEKIVKKLEEEIGDIRNNSIYENAFEWRFEFPAVLDAEGTFVGFDVVVGNPPYVRQEALADLKPYLKDNYEVFAGTADLLVYFIELGMNNLAAKGQFSFIIANKFMRAGFGKALRRYIPQFRIRELIDFGDLPVFEEATTYPLIISLEKATPTGEFLAANMTELQPKAFRESLAAVRFSSLQTGLTEEGWNLADVKTQRLLEKLKNTGVSLGEYVNGEIYRGVLTGFNEAFVIDAETKDRLIAEDPKSEEVIKPFLDGKDLKKYLSPITRKYLIFARRGIDIGQYPAVLHHLEKYKPHLETRPSDWPKNQKWEGRKPGNYPWYEIQDTIAYHEKFKVAKIVWPEVAKDNQITYAPEDYLLNKTSFMIPLENDQLLGILNSSLITFYLDNIVSKMRGGYFMLSKIYMETIPVLDTTDKKITSLTTRILALKKADPGADTSALEAEIDVLVYKLYGLTYEEVLVVDPAFELSEEGYNGTEHS